MKTYLCFLLKLIFLLILFNIGFTGCGGNSMGSFVNKEKIKKCV